MSEKFKVGDKVRLVDHGIYTERDGLVLQTRYVVVKVDDQHNGFIKVDKAIHRLWHASGNFELVNAEPDLFFETVKSDASANERALRYDSGKPELIYPDMFPAALAGVARVYMYGTQRPNRPYPRYNFTKPAPFTELYNCARRHMVKWLNGEDSDPDAVAAGFDVNHIDAAIGNLMRLRQQIADAPQEDDRAHVKVSRDAD